MRDYIRVWTSILYDADPIPTGQTRAGFFRMGNERNAAIPAAAQEWIDLYKNVGGYTDPQLMLNEPRWYGWTIDALIEDLNTAYFVGANYSAFTDGTQQYYEPKSGHIDIFIASPRQVGFNSLVELPTKRSSAVA
jgi:hypothetical protein